MKADIVDLDSYVTLPPRLVVEVLAGPTRRKDAVYKRSKYEDIGIRSYWMVDPDGPSVIVCELREGRYAETARASGDEAIAVDLPLPLILRPAAWLRA